MDRSAIPAGEPYRFLRAIRLVPKPLAVHPGKRSPVLTLRIAFWVAVAVATIFCAFVLPFFFPPATPGYAPTYTVGADNRVAAISVALVSALVALVCWKIPIAPAHSTPVSGTQLLPFRFFYAATAAVLAFTAILGFLVVRDGHFYSDSGYFLTQLRAGFLFHRTLFRQIEFPYGPLLFAWPENFLRALVPLGLSMTAAYMVSLAAMEVLGFALLFYTVRALPISRTMQAAAFLLIAFTCLDPLLGLNYTPFRFILPAAGVVFLSGQQKLARACLAAAIIEALQAAVSPELAVAFGAAAAAYGIYRAIVIHWRWLAVVASAYAGAVAYILTRDRGSFQTMGKFAAGSFNLILEPAPHLLVLLFATVALAPLAVAWLVPHDRTPALAGSPVAFSARVRTAGLAIPLYVAALGMLPAAFGRCDPLHVFYNGLGIYLLAFVALDRFSLPWKRTGVAIIALSFLYTQAQDFAFYRGPLSKLIHRTYEPEDDLAIAPALQQAVGPARVLFPWNAPILLANRLTQTGNYQPDFYCVMPLDPATEQRKIAEMRQNTYLMVPNDMPLVTENPISNQHGLRHLLRFGYQYKPRRAPYLSGAMMYYELRQHWSPIQSLGVYTLYRRIN